MPSGVPGNVHEGVRLLFQKRPRLVGELLAARGIELPAGDPIEDANAFTDLSPPSYAADIVIRVGRTVGATEACAIVEVQDRIDDDKRYAWPRYAATVHAQRRCPTWVVVIATTRRVAEWARRPIESFQPGWGFRPIVVGPDEVPRITDVEAARACPELAVLSAMMHGRDDDGPRVAAAAIEAARSLDAERRHVYTDMAFSSLPKVARAALEAIMAERGYEPLTEEIRESLHRGRAEGRDEGRVEGRAEGRAEALRATIVKLCRGFDVPWTEEHASAVAALDEAGLDALVDTIIATRGWPSH